jgi:hypothetical protein
MMLLALAAGLALAPVTPTPCPFADIAVAAIRLKLVKARGVVTSDRLIVTADLVNVGAQGQAPGIRQHAELIRNGAVIAKQPLPALAAGVRYPLAFGIFRDTSQRTDPLEVMVRYVLDGARSPERQNCSAANDRLTKTF